MILGYGNSEETRGASLGSAAEELKEINAQASKYWNKIDAYQCGGTRDQLQ